MIVIDRLGSFDEIVSGHQPDVVQLASALRSLIEEVGPDATEVPRRGEGVAAYGWGEKKMIESFTCAFGSTLRGTGCAA